jgi:hypothetical protein
VDEAATRQQLAGWTPAQICMAMETAAREIQEFHKDRATAPDTAEFLVAWTQAFKDYDEEEAKRFIELCREELARRRESCS